MGSLILSCSSLQMPLTAAVYFIVLKACRTEECRLQLGEKTKERSVTLGDVDIRMCHVNCVGDAFILAWCLQLHGDSKPTLMPGRTRPKNQNNVLKPSCGSKVCSEDLLVKGCSTECVKTTPSQARDRDIFTASREGDLERVKRILAAGHVDINSRGTHRRTPVMMAAREGHRDVVEFLVGRGADVSMLASGGYTVLHLACWSGDLETVKLILSLHKVDINAKNNRGLTATDYAKRYRRQQVFDFMVSRGGHIR